MPVNTLSCVPSPSTCRLESLRCETVQDLLKFFAGGLVLSQGFGD